MKKRRNGGTKSTRQAQLQVLMQRLSQPTLGRCELTHTHTYPHTPFSTHARTRACVALLAFPSVLVLCVVCLFVCFPEFSFSFLSRFSRFPFASTHLRLCSRSPLPTHPPPLYRPPPPPPLLVSARSHKLASSSRPPASPFFPSSHTLPRVHCTVRPVHATFPAWVSLLPASLLFFVFFFASAMLACLLCAPPPSCLLPRHPCGTRLMATGKLSVVPCHVQPRRVSRHTILLLPFPSSHLGQQPRLFFALTPPPPLPPLRLPSPPLAILNCRIGGAGAGEGGGADNARDHDASPLLVLRPASRRSPSQSPATLPPVPPLLMRGA